MESFQESPSLVYVDAFDQAKISQDYDSLVVITTSTKESKFPGIESYNTLLESDSSSSKSTTFVATNDAPGKRLIVSPIVSLNSDGDDVSRFAEAAKSSILRAKSAGSTRPFILFENLPEGPEFVNAVEVSLLAMYQALYVPLQAREFNASKNDESQKEITSLAFHVSKGSNDVKNYSDIANVIYAIEQGKRLARDTGGSDPERMTPRLFASYLSSVFASLAPNVKVTVNDDQENLRKEYPLLSAVNRGSHERHSAVVVRLEYVGEGDIQETVLLAGKGVTYDTGGNNIKVGNHMSGMSRDKCGAANVSGFILTAALLKAKNVRLIGEIGLVRNACGSNAFVADEILLGHSGKRVKIINTDAEGRLVLADILSHLREEALKSVNPTLFSMATLTGHSVVCFGEHTSTMDNGPSLKKKVSKSLKKYGDLWNDPFEVSSVRRCDLEKTKPKEPTYDVIQHSSGDRGHQFAAAFLFFASGLSNHGKDSENPLPFTHLDIAGSACEGTDYTFGKVTGATLTALVAKYVLKK